MGIEDLAKKLDQLNEQLTILRIEMAEYRVRMNDGRRLYAIFWGVLGGAVSAASVAMVDVLFRR